MEKAFARSIIVMLAVNLLLAPGSFPQTKKSRPISASASPTATFSRDELAKLQAVLETSLGQIVIEFYPDKAPMHVNYFARLVKSGFYDGTTFHRVILRGIVQGGDPLSIDPGKRALYGSGGLKKLKAEFNDTPHVRGTVSAVLLPGDPNSAGSQFFICVSDQPQLEGKFTAWGHVIEGMDLVDKISAIPADANQLALERVEIKKAFLRPIRPPQPIPFSESSKEELKKYRVQLETSLGKIEVELLPEAAPEHVRNFLKLAKVGLYDGTAWHRVVPGFVIQGGDLGTRAQPPGPEQISKFVRNLQLEISELKHERGTVSMARAEALDSASTSFFICLDAQPSLDGKYTVFGKVDNGMEVVDKIAAVPLIEAEKPSDRIELIRAEVIDGGK
jgi:cyclophilin family peptidyl-prolyl cis-trans isomerase